MNLTKTRFRSSYGASTAELPVVLLVLLILIAFPLIDIATIGLRATTVFSAAREAARAAGRSRTFLADTTEGPSASTAAKDKATHAVGHNTKIAASDVKLYIIGTPLKGGTPIRQTSPLAEAKPADYIYQIEVEVKGFVDPLVTLDPHLFGNVPGLTVPIEIIARNSEYSEFPKGLTQ